MSRNGNYWDRACTERIFCSAKMELMGDTMCPPREAAQTAAFEYSERFYNTKRRHASLD